MHSLTHWPGYGGIASRLHRISIIEFRECELLQQHDFPERKANTAYQSAGVRMVRVMGLPDVPNSALAQIVALSACAFQILEYVEQQLAHA